MGNQRASRNGRLPLSGPDSHTGNLPKFLEGYTTFHLLAHKTNVAGFLATYFCVYNTRHVFLTCILSCSRFLSAGHRTYQPCVAPVA